MGPIWGRQDPGGPHVGPMNLAIWDMFDIQSIIFSARHMLSTNFMALCKIVVILSTTSKWHCIIDCWHHGVIHYRYYDLTRPQLWRAIRFPVYIHCFLESTLTVKLCLCQNIRRFFFFCLFVSFLAFVRGLYRLVFDDFIHDFILILQALEQSNECQITLKRPWRACENRSQPTQPHYNFISIA